jgi:hypothetical protein
MMGHQQQQQQRTMMKRKPKFLWILLGLCCLGWCQLAVAWNQLPPNDHSSLSPPRPTRKAFLSGFLAVASAGLTTTCGLLAPPLPVLAFDSVSVSVSDSTSSDDNDFQAELKRSLRPPTDERPPISLPADAFRTTTDQNNKSRGPSMNNNIPPPTTIQALIALTNPQIRPSPGDVLVIQVYDGPDDGNNRPRLLLGGAKVPVARIRFPVQIQLTTQNAAIPAAIPAAAAAASLQKSKSKWEELASSQDLWIVASINHKNDNDNDDGSYSTFYAAGISKFLTSLPGLDAETLQSLGQSGIRTPASLTLSSVAVEKK